MENLKYTKEYAELQAKKAYLGTKHNNKEIEAFTYGYLHSIDETGTRDMLEALKAMLSRFESTDLGMAKADHVRQLAINAINKATK